MNYSKGVIYLYTITGPIMACAYFSYFLYYFHKIKIFEQIFKTLGKNGDSIFDL